MSVEHNLHSKTKRQIRILFEHFGKMLIIQKDSENTEIVAKYRKNEITAGFQGMKHGR